jgi:outer membrane protein assembly factor BamB
VASDGTIYACSLTRLHAITADGELVWRSQRRPLVSSFPMLGLQGRIYLAAGDDDPEAALGTLLAFDYLGREEQIFHRVDEQLTAVVQDGAGILYVRSQDAEYIEQAQGRLYALSPGGSLLWTHDGIGVRGIAPVVAPDGTILVGGGAPAEPSRVIALSPGGTVRWELFLDGAVEALLAGNAVVDREGTLYFGAEEDGHATVLAVSAQGNVRWRVGLPGSYAIVLALGEQRTLYVMADRKLFELKSPETPTSPGNPGDPTLPTGG